MAFFAPIGLGTISEEGSELVTNKGSGITKAGWGGLAVPLNSDNAQCSVSSKNNTKIKTNEANWGVTTSYVPWSFSPPLSTRVGVTKITFSGIDFHCEKTKNTCPTYMIKGDYGIKNSIFVATNLPQYTRSDEGDVSYTGYYTPRTASQKEATRAHEQKHANAYQALQQIWYSHSEFNKVWDTKEKCDQALGRSDQTNLQPNTLQGKVNIDFRIVHYKECMHFNHDGEAMISFDENGHQMFLTFNGEILRYPLNPDSPLEAVREEASLCNDIERYPFPHEY